MALDPIPGLTRIGVFYDGSYFLHVSNYYNWFHERQARISISGLHEFIRSQVAREENTEPRLCQIIDAHYFRGRLTAAEANQRDNQLYYDRVFDDIMMMEGVSTHYLPIRHSAQGTKQEKGVDVWLALEAYELAILKRFDVIVLITSDGDFVPLVRKLNTLGTRVMVLSWDFEYVNDNGARMVTRTSQDLLEEVTYPIPMHQIIEDRVRGQELLVNNLFVQQKADRRVPARQPMYAGEAEAPGMEDNGEVFESEVITLNKGYGFVRHTPDNLFFYYLDLINTEFSDLIIGDRVRYKVGLNDKGESVARNVERIEE